MRNGQVFELAQLEHHIDEKEYSSLPTPTVSDQYTADLKSTQQSKGSLHSVSLAQIVNRPDLLPTPLVDDAKNTGHNKTRINTLAAEAYDLGNNALLPTPIVRDYKDGQAPAVRDGVVQTDTVGRAVMNSGEISEISWGKFEPAIRRWQQLTRPAPSPVKADGKDGSNRLSAEFAEWMMGLPQGWVTNIDITRNAQLKALGNGVVPQQAEEAIKYLLGISNG
jgi:DNA (cytosine-5)-methyltransferase 1